MPQNLFVQFVCLSPKVLDFNEKRLHWASVVRDHITELQQNANVEIICMTTGTGGQVGNIIVRVFKLGVQNWKDFCLKINISKGNY
jgi:hypothetical protein